MSTTVASEEAKQQETPAPNAGQGRMKWILAVVVVIAAIGGAVYWQWSAGRVSTDDAQIEAHLHAVSARVGGTVTKVMAKDNQAVEAGTVLFEIDPADYQVAVDRAAADVAEAEATLAASRTNVPIVSITTSSGLSSAEAGVSEASAGVGTSESQVQMMQARLVTAEAMVREAKANSDRAARDLERMKQLVGKEEISKQQYDAAAAAADATRAQLEAVTAQHREAEQGIRVAQSQLEQQKIRVTRAQAEARSAQSAPKQVAASEARANSAAAKLQQMQAALAQAKLNLSYTVVRAPVSGIVSQKSIEEGQVIAGGQPVLSIVPLEETWVVANFKENQLAHMRPGQKVKVAVDAYGRDYEGHVESIAAATGARFSLLPPENATGNYVKVVQRVPVRIAIEKGQDPDHQLRPGMSVVPTVLVK
ncbi:MAG: HlyD family secretion protein [Bryobacteraceae bacterium]